MESILQTTKKLLGMDENYTAFDVDVIIQINMAIAVLTQMGVGPIEGFTIENEYATYEDFIPGAPVLQGLVKDYIYLKTRLVFDPPTISSVLAAMERSIAELEWRINVQVDPGNN